MTYYKTELRIRITADDAELVTKLRDDLEVLVGHRTTRLIEKNKGKLIGFETRTHAAILADKPFPKED